MNNDAIGSFFCGAGAGAVAANGLEERLSDCVGEISATRAEIGEIDAVSEVGFLGVDGEVGVELWV